MIENFFREITPIKENDCFLIFDRERNTFDFPLHFHPEFEINYIYNAKGAKRVVGDHIGEVDDYELVMVGPNLYHGWENNKYNRVNQLHEITIQFTHGLYTSEMLNKNILKPIKELLLKAERGISFSKETIIRLEPKLFALSKEKGYESFLILQSILFELATSKDQKTLSNISFQQDNDLHSTEKIEKIYDWIKENHQEKLKLQEAADLLNMSLISFSRMIKKHTGKTFVEFTNEVRLGYATRLLLESNESVAEICYNCGFNNISNFNRIFRKKQGCTPSEFRDNFNGIKTVH